VSPRQWSQNKIFCFRFSVFCQSVPASRGCPFIRFGTELLFLPSRQWILRALVCYFLFLFKQTVFQKSSNIIKLIRVSPIHLLTLNHFSFYYQRYHFFQTLKLQKFSPQTIIPQRVRASGRVWVEAQKIYPGWRSRHPTQLALF
jgi:hypothetical protein